MTASQSSAKCRKAKLLRGYKRIPDLIEPHAAGALEYLMKQWKGTATSVIQESLITTAQTFGYPHRDNSPA